MRLKFLTAAVLFASTADATAGPLLDRLRARVHRPACASGQCQPATAFPAPAAPATTAPVVTLPAGSACANGVCPAPTVVRRGVFR